MPDFLIQFLAGALSAIVGAVFAALVPIRTRRERWSKAPKVAAKNGRGATQVILADRVAGDVSIDIDNSRAIVVNNIAASYQPKTPDETPQSDDSMWLAVLAAVVAAGLFVSYHLFLFWFTVGVVVGLLAALVIGTVRAARFNLWNRQATGVVLEVTISLATAVWTWVSVATLQRNGHTIGELSDRVSAAAAENRAPADPAGVFVDALLDPAIQLVKIGLADNLLGFALMLMGAAVISVVALIWSWSSLLDWFTYMGFMFGRASERMAKRAYRFEQRTWRQVAWHLFPCGIGILLASGLLLRYMDAGVAGGFPLPAS